MKKMMAIFVLLFAAAAVFLAAAFSANAAEEELKDVGSNGLKISASADEGENKDYTYAGGVLTIISDKKMTISSSGNTTADRIVVNSTNGADITLSNVNIDSYSTGAAAFEISAATIGDVKITLDGKNILKSASYCAGLQKTSDECKLIIQGNANGLGENEYNLEAAGGTNGAGIGGGAGHAGKNITIESGKIKASSNGGAGIGGGDGGDGTDIKICGSADVTAVGSTGAGIGGGSNKAGKDIEIYGNAKVYVNCGNSNGAGIGGGGYGDGTGIKIYDNAEVETACYTGAGIGGGFYGVGKNIEIYGNVTIKATSTNGGAGIGGGQNKNGENITIKGGKLIEATGGNGGAGIGGGAGGGYGITIKISGGTVNATGRQTSAGIGGGNGGEGSDIEISGGKVTAISLRTGGAGIGGGMMGDGSNIKISGGEVFALCGSIGEDGTITAATNGAGIGGGYRFNNKGGNGSNIQISGGKVTAIGGTGGAGIGGGNGGKGSDIEISGGTVEATIANTSGNAGAGIGGGYNGDAENIKITGGTVKAFVPCAAPAIGSGGGSGSVNGIYISGNADIIAAATGAAGIGCGSTSTSEVKNIEIFGSATVRAFSMDHAGIGGTTSTKTVDTIKIYEDANVTAIGGNSGAGIGGSPTNNQQVKNISIYGNASVTAIAGYGGAGIGGGAWNNGSTISGISISDNATVIATGSGGGAGIGSGSSQDTATDITISDNATVIASSAYNKDLYDSSIYDITLTINGTGISGFANGNIQEWMSHFSTNAGGVGIGSNTADECVITIEGGTVTAYGNTKPGIGGDNAVVTIKGKSSTSCPIVCTNEIKSTTDPADYPTEYWGIVFEDTHTNFDKGIVYGDGKAVDLSERPETYTLDNGKVLTVLDKVTFKPGNKFTLDGSTLYLKEDATLDKWYEMTKVNGGEIQHVHSSQYEWYDVKDYSFVATDYTTLYKSGDKEGIVLCDICGKPQYHDLAPDDGWENNEDYHWHTGTCEPGLDCSVDRQAITECSYIKVFSGEFDKGEHRYDFSEPEKKDGKLHFYCIDCNYEILMDIPIISLIKVDGATNDPLIGAEFGLYTNAACTGTPSATGTTATENGKAVVSFEAMPNMTYYIKETKAPDGYKLSDKIFMAVVDEDGKVTYGDNGSETPSICENTVNANEPAPDDNNSEPDPDDNNGSEPDPDDNNGSEPDPDDNGDSKPAPDDNGDSKPAPDDNGDSKPAPDDNGDSKPAPDNNGDSKPAPDDNGESKPAPDNNSDSKPDDNDNPNTGVGIGIAGLTLLGGSLCVVAVTKGRRKKKNSNDSDIDF